MQHCNMFQTPIFKENFKQITNAMPTFKTCKHEVTIAIRQNLYVLMQVSHLSKLFKMCKK
jgi:hypothetical protein